MLKNYGITLLCASMTLLGNTLGWAGAHNDPSHLAQANPEPPRAGDQAQQATGIVYLDENQNLQYDPGETGIAGVSVSNGLAVVQTDDDGRYRLPVSEQTIIFITKPADYMVPVNEVQLPQFYYLHYPNGSKVNLKYGGIEPTGPLSESIDFPLFKSEFTEKFNALAFADSQTRNNTHLSYFRDDVVSELIGYDNALFGLTAGDVVDDDLSLYTRHNQLMATIGLPWWNVPGNHDMNYDAPSDAESMDTFKRVFGPTYYSYDYGQVHFVALDNIEYFGAEKGSYRGYLALEQIEWLENDLKFVPKDKLIVVITHIPLYTDAVDAGERQITVNLPELLAVLEGREHVYSMSGHDTSNSWQMYLDHTHGWSGPKPLHHQVLAEVRGDGWRGPKNEYGVPETTMQDGNPNGYYLISFDGVEYKTRFKAAGDDKEYQMRIMFEQEASGRNQLDVKQYEFAGWQSPQLVVNVFDGGERHEVMFKIDDGEYAPMTHTLRSDPYMEDRYLKYSDSDTPVGAPVMSSHIWVAGLPKGLEKGVHAVTVRVKDPYNQIMKDSQIFELR